MDMHVFKKLMARAMFAPGERNDGYAHPRPGQGCRFGPYPAVIRHGHILGHDPPTTVIFGARCQGWQGTFLPVFRIFPPI